MHEHVTLAAVDAGILANEFAASDLGRKIKPVLAVANLVLARQVRPLDHYESENCWNGLRNASPGPKQGNGVAGYSLAALMSHRLKYRKQPTRSGRTGPYIIPRSPDRDFKEHTLERW